MSAVFVLSDPDGVSGATEKVVTTRTRKEPEPAHGGHVYHVYPIGWTGPKQEPAFTGLMAAYYTGGAHYDYENAYPPRVQPGEHDSGPRWPLHRRSIPLHERCAEGWISRARKCIRRHVLSDAEWNCRQADRDKGAGDGEVIFDGDGCQNLFKLMGW